MATGDGIIWQETAPDDDTNISDGDNYQVHDIKAVRMRLAHEHTFPSSQTGTSEAGYHKFMTFQPGTTAASDLISGSTAGAFVCKSSGTGYEAYLCTIASGTAANDNVQITFVGGLNAGALKVGTQAVGDIIYANSTSGFTRVAIGTTGDLIYSVDGTAPGYISLADFGTSFTGGTGLVTVGDVTAGTFSGIVNLATNAFADGSVGAAGQVLVSGGDGANPAWSSLLGDWVDKSGGYGAQQATTDGFVMVSIAVNGSVAAQVDGYTDSDADPTTIRASCGTDGTHSNPNMLFIFFAVKKSDYWKVVFNAGSVSKLYWIPIGA